MLGSGFGQVTLHGDAPDKLDFFRHDRHRHDPSDGTFNAGASALTVDGTAPSSIDLLVADAASLISDVNSALAKIKQVVDTVDSANAALSSILPFLGASGTPSLDRLTNLISSFNGLVTAVQAKLATIPSSSVSLGTVITKITSALGTLSATNALGTFTVGTRYSTSSTGVFVYLTLDQTQPNATACLTSPTNGCLVTSVPLDLGPTLTGLGISLDADSTMPGAQAPTFSVAATLGGHLGVGFDSSSPSSGVFIDPTGQIGLGVAASLSSATVTINLGLLQASASLHDLGPLTGTASLALPGGSTPIPLSSFSAADVTPSFSAQLAHSLFTIDLSVAAGVQVSSVDLSNAAAHVKLLVSLGDSTDFVDHPNTVSLFGDNGQTPAIHVEAHTSLGGGSNLLNSLDPSSPSFGNADPNTILGMLSQVASFFASMASQQFLGTQIPFTSVTLGQLLDYAQQFKHEFLDPLFKSGDSTHPDGNGDGKVDLQDFNFSGIQSLLTRLSAALGLGGSGTGGSGGPLTASYEPSTGVLAFNFSITEQAGIGTNVQVTTGPGATVVDAGGSPDIQWIVLNADAGSPSQWTVSYGGQSTHTPFQWNDPANVVEAAIQSLPGLASATVTRPSVGIYRVLLTGVASPQLLAVDSSNLADDSNVQTIVVPAGTSNFWIGYPDANGVLQLTDPLSAGISEADLTTKLQNLSGIGAGHVTVHQVVGTSETVYLVTLSSPAVQMKALAAAGGVSLDFGGSLGGLASLQTSGSVIPLAKLVAEGTFGINLKSSTSVSVGPSAFQNGPQAPVTTIQQGGKSITVTKVRAGVLNQVDAVWLVTVKGGGTFTLGTGGAPTAGLAPGTDITSAVEGLNSSWSGHVHVSTAHQPEGVVYTITWDNSVAPVTTFAGNGSGLTGQNEIDEVQIQNATGGTFTLMFNGGAVTEGNAVTMGALSSDLNGLSAITTVPNTSTVGSVAVTSPSAGTFDIQFQGGWAGTDVADAATDSTNLVGALDTASHPGNGTLPADATFDAEITDGPAILTKIVTDGTASVTATTTRDGGTGLGINTTTQGGSANEVQTLNVRASSGMFTLTFNGNTTSAIDAGLGATALATAVASALNASPVSANVTVTGADTVGGKLLTITFATTGDKAQLQPTTTTAFVGVNELQTVTVAGAVGGTFKLTYNGTPSGDIQFDGSNLASVIGSLVGGTVTVTGPVSNTFTVEFSGGTGVAASNVKPLNPGALSLTAQNEVQFVQVLNATGGTFTLTTSTTTNGTATSSTATGITYNSVIDASARPNSPTATAAAGGSLAAGDYYYVITALTAAGEGLASAEVHATADATHKTINLSWSTVAGATGGYRIYRGSIAGGESAYFTGTVPAGTTTFSDDASASPTGNAVPPTNLTEKLSNMPALGAGANEVTITGSFATGWTITFNGLGTAGKHFDKFVGDPGGLLNSITLPSIHVVVQASATGTDLNGDGKIDQNDVVVAVQKALDAAAVTAGITPGFLSAGVVHGTTPFTAGSAWFQQGATDDEALEVVVPVTPGTISAKKGTLAVPGTTGNFTITIAGVTTNTIAIGSGAQVVQSAIQALQGFTDTVTVTQSGNTYTLTFGSTPFSAVSGMVLLNGSVPVASEDTVAHFESALQSQIQSLLQTAGIGAGTIAVGDDGSSATHPKLTISSSSLDFGLAFQEPVIATVGGGRVSLTAPQVLRTADTSLPSLSISRSVNADVKDFNDASLQVLGLATSPTRLTYSSALSEIDFTLFVNNATIPIAVTDFTGVTDIAGLVNKLQTKIDAALAASFASGELTAPAQIQVCRPNINPAAGACDDVGNRITFLGVSGVTTLAIDVPAKLANGTTDNGAVTELGFQAITGATSHGQAGRFFLNNVHLTGTVELVLQDVSATASLGFLSLTGTATGTLPEQRLLSLTADIRLRNPLVGDGNPDQYLLDIGTLINAIRAGHFLYNSADATMGGSKATPTTGFFQGKLSGGFGGDLTIKPGGVLSGLPT